MNKIKNKQIIIMSLAVLASAVIQAFSLTSFSVPAGIYPSGITGFSRLVSDILEDFAGIKLPFFYMYMAINIILAIVVYKHIGKLFTIFSVLQTTLVSLFSSFFPVHHIIYNTQRLHDALKRQTRDLTHASQKILDFILRDIQFKNDFTQFLFLGWGLPARAQHDPVLITDNHTITVKPPGHMIVHVAVNGHDLRQNQQDRVFRQIRHTVLKQERFAFIEPHRNAGKIADERADIGQVIFFHNGTFFPAWPWSISRQLYDMRDKSAIQGAKNRLQYDMLKQCSDEWY